MHTYLVLLKTLPNSIARTYTIAAQYNCIALLGSHHLWGENLLRWWIRLWRKYATPSTGRKWEHYIFV